MIRQLITAWRGRRIWLGLKRRYNIDSRTWLILMPDGDDALDERALANLPDFLAFQHADGAVVALMNAAPESARHGRNISGSGGPAARRMALRIVHSFPGNQMDALLCYYRLIKFKPETKVISAREPYGTGGLLHVPGVDMDYFVKVYYYDGVGYLK